MVDPLGGARLWKRDVLGRTRVFQDEEGYERETRYDADGRIVFAEKQGSNSVETSYTNENDYNYVHDPGLSIPNVTKREQVDGVNATTAVWTDQLGRELARKRADGSRLEIVYDGHRAARAAVNDHLGNTVQMIEWTDDGFGRIGTEVGPFNPAAPVNAPVVDLDWSAAGRLVRIDAAGEVTERDYGADHGLLERERFLGLEKSFAYASPQSGNGLRLEAISEVAQAGGSVRDSTFTYDSIGRLVQTKVSTPGQTVIREINGYDALGGPTATLATTDDGGSIDTVLQQFGYDALGRRLTRSTVVDGTSHGSTSWTYHGNGVVQSVTSPSGQVVAYDYGADFDYELDTITGGPTLLFEVLTRDGAGRPIQVARPTSTTDITYDDMGRQIGRFDTFSGTVLKSWEGSYNALGQLFWERQLHDGQSWDNNFGYDGAGRLISEFNGRDNATHDYELSASGKRISTTTTDGTGAKTVVSFGYVGELLDSVDGMSLAYDDWNAVVTDQRGTQYGRDASGSVRTIDDGSQVFRVIRDAANMPVALVEPSGTRVTHWDLNPADLPVEVVTAAGDTVRYAAGVGAVFRASFGAGGAPLPAGTGMLDYNAASSLLSEGNQEVDPGTAFGAGQSPVATDRFAFARMESLPGLSDVFMARHRFYDAATGRFLSPDPLGLGGGSHRMLYAKGNPIKWNDPLGLSSNCDDPATLVAAPTIHPADLTIYIEVDEPEVETMSRSEVSALIKEISAKYAGFGDIGGSASLPGGGCGYIGCGPAGGGEGGASSFGLGAGFGGALAATQGGQPDADGGPGTLTTADDFTFDVWGAEENPEIGNFRLADEEKTKKEIREENKAKRQEQRDDKKADREERKERPAEEKKAKLDVLGWVKRLVGGAGGGGQGAAAGRRRPRPNFQSLAFRRAIPSPHQAPRRLHHHRRRLFNRRSLPRPPLRPHRLLQVLSSNPKRTLR